MDRDYRSPQDIARVAPDQLEQSLVKVLRRGVVDRPFVYRLKFEFQGGRTGPLLFIGNLNRAWNDYVTGNARANDLAVGTCSSGRGEVGRTRISLRVTGGRGTRAGNLLELNRMLRRINVEAVFVDPDAEDGAGDAADGALDLPAEARVIRSGFEEFKSEPTPERLAELEGAVARWLAALDGASGMAESKEAAFVKKLADVLAAKGQSYLAKAGSSS